MSPCGSCAIVGGGLAGFTAYAALLHAGIEPGEITVFGTSLDPAATWRRRAAAIRQQRMRSESDGHCLATSFPGLAVRAARHGDLRPLVGTISNRYQPSVAEFLEHVAELRASSGWDERVRLGRVDRVTAIEDGFSLGDHGVFRHVLLAPGNPGLSLPDELADDPRAVHAYEPHDYAESVAVVGAGMAAATEWLNALDAGARVVSVRRREPTRRPLNVTRPYFSRRGLGRFHRTERRERTALLRDLLAPSYPPGRRWDEPLALAATAGRFSVAPTVNGEQQIICATGFRRGFAHDPLLANLVADHELDVHDRWIVLDADCTVPALTDDSRTLALAGVPAQWAFPAADTVVGAKYAARRFARRVRGEVKACPTR